ncbi:hypothetical protein GXW82_26535 [Streptacidiphilus sp. 4-A2]|nr:hypothetical protein [Streptacidiphilus sp. 4-A2]
MPWPPTAGRQRADRTQGAYDNESHHHHEGACPGGRHRPGPHRLHQLQLQQFRQQQRRRGRQRQDPGHRGQPGALLLQRLQPAGPHLRQHHREHRLAGLRTALHDQQHQCQRAPIPWLAKSYAWSNGNRTLTMTLQSGVKWSDGKPFSSADVAFTFNLLQKFPAANTGNVPTATSITTPDADTVVMNFAAPQSANFVGIANQMILPQHLWASVTNPVNAVIPAAQAIGTGPYLVDSFSTQDITYKVNPSYWGAKPKVPRISLPAYATNDAATLALASGDVDLTGNDIANVQSVFVAKDPAHNHLFQSSAPYYPAGNTVSLLLNNKSADAPALADAKVRQAISAGVDRASLASQCETDYEAPATSSGGVTLPTDSGALDPALTNDLQSGPDAAKVSSLLQADGYARTGGKWTKGGKTIKFTIIDPNSFGDYWCDAKAIAAGLDARASTSPPTAATPATPGAPRSPTATSTPPCTGVRARPPSSASSSSWTRAAPRRSASPPAATWSATAARRPPRRSPPTRTRPRPRRRRRRWTPCNS